MKLNLECGNDVRNGYVNVNMGVVDLSKVEPGIKFVVGNFSNLDPLVKDESVSEINFCPILNRIDPNGMVKLMSHWLKKLAVNGKLTLQFIDIRRISKDIWSGKLGLQDIHLLILGQNHDHLSILDLSVIKNTVRHLGATLLNITFDEYTTNIELQKNANN